MEWNGTRYTVYGSPEQITKIFTDAFRVHNRIEKTGEQFDKFFATHKDFIEAYCPLDKKESYVGELMFQLQGQNSIVIDDINNYDGFYIRPALVERYGELEFEAVQEFSLGGPASSRKEFPRELFTREMAQGYRRISDGFDEPCGFNLDNIMSFVSSEKKNSNERFTKLDSAKPSKKDSQKTKSKNRKP